MKKIVTLLLAVLLGLCAAAGAEFEQPLESAGMTLHIPDAFNETEGAISLTGGGELDAGSGIYYAELYYLGIPSERLEALNAKGEDITEAELEEVQNAYAPLVAFLAIDQGRDFSDINAYLGDVLDPALATEIARADDCTFYSYIETGDLAGSALAGEYEKLRGLVGDLVAASDFYKPVDPNERVVGSVLRFETTDIDGNPVDSAELFAQHEITLLNVWATWCGPCVGELEDLQAIDGRLAEKDCAVVGLLQDGTRDDAVGTGKALMAEHGVTYAVILPPENMNDLFEIQYLPTTFFVDRTGRVIGEPIVGAAVERYEEALEALLDGK